MANYLDLTPVQLRQLAEQHHKRAQEIRKWGEIPHEWLKEFPDGYGAIAGPMHGALGDYYQKRHDKAELLAGRHDATHDQLIAAVNALEKNEEKGGNDISRSGVTDPGPSVTAGGAPMVSPNPIGRAPGNLNPHGDRVHQLASVSPDDVVPDSAAALDRVSPSQPIASSDVYGRQPGDAGPGIMTPSMTGPDDAVPDVGHSDQDMSAGLFTGTPVGAGPSDFAQPLDGITGALAPGPQLGSSAVPMAGLPAPLPSGWLFAAAQGASRQRGRSSMVVGEQPESDLALARTVLGAVLAAVSDITSDVEWAVGTIRTASGILMLLTSTEGRGWLPAGLYLPSEVHIPWRWDFTLGEDDRAAVAACEGDSDPSRILVDFALRVVRMRNARISALVSSTEVSHGLRYALGDAAIEADVRAAEPALDLSAPGAGLVDRLTLAGSDELLRLAEIVPEAEIRNACLQLAQSGDALVRRAVAGHAGDVAARRDVRARLLDAIRKNRPIPPTWWDELHRTAERAHVTAMPGPVTVSGTPSSPGTWGEAGDTARRSAAFERRADELLVLVATGSVDRQRLRDVLYAYGQIAGHPEFRTMEAAVAIGTIASAETETYRSHGPVADSARHNVIGPSKAASSPLFAESLNGATSVDGPNKQRRAR